MSHIVGSTRCLDFSAQSCNPLFWLAWWPLLGEGVGGGLTQAHRESSRRGRVQPLRGRGAKSAGSSDFAGSAFIFLLV